jgi:hypothetical protein
MTAARVSMKRRAEREVADAIAALETAGADAK